MLSCSFHDSGDSLCRTRLQLTLRRPRNRLRVLSCSFHDSCDRLCRTCLLLRSWLMSSSLKSARTLYWSRLLSCCIFQLSLCFTQSNGIGKVRLLLTQHGGSLLRLVTYLDIRSRSCSLRSRGEGLLLRSWGHAGNSRLVILLFVLLFVWHFETCTNLWSILMRPNC